MCALAHERRGAAGQVDIAGYRPRRANRRVRDCVYSNMAGRRARTRALQCVCPYAARAHASWQQKAQLGADPCEHVVKEALERDDKLGARRHDDDRAHGRQDGRKDRHRYPAEAAAVRRRARALAAAARLAAALAARADDEE